MKATTKLFVSGFLVALICVAGLLGFLVVDLSAERYMPGKVGALFAVSGLEAGKVDVSLMGREYYLNLDSLGKALKTLEPCKGFLPLPMQTAEVLAEALYEGITGSGR